MQNNVCKSCGGDIRREGNYYVCNFCGSRWTIDADSDVHVIDRANAWGALRDYDFERSVELFEYILSKEPKNHEAYWGRALADAGIVYVTDLNESKRVPTCNNIREISFIASRDVQKAISLAPADIAESYRAQAEAIESIRSEWLKKASKEPPYDVFICFKDSDREHNLERTEDSYDAQELYYALTSKGYKVFFSRVSLRNKIAEHYEPYIYNAIKTAKVMIVFGEKPEYFSAVWVKNEWNRFRARIERGEKDKSSLVVAYKGMDPGDLPAGLRSRQCLNAADITFLDDLKAHIDKVIKAQAPKPQPQSAPKTVSEPQPPVKKKKKKTGVVIAIILALCIGLGILIPNLERSGITIDPPEVTNPQGSIGGIFFPLETTKPDDGKGENGGNSGNGGNGDYTLPIFDDEDPTEVAPDDGKLPDADENGNGIPDDQENDYNGNGIIDYLEKDNNGNGIPDYMEGENNPDIDTPVFPPDGGSTGDNYSEGLDYALSIDGESYIVVGKGSFTGEALIIPSKYEGKPVTAIEADAFYGCTQLESVSIPDSVTSIGECAFYGCENIVTMNIPFIGATAEGTENRHFGYIFGAYSPDDQGNIIPQELSSVTVTGDYDVPDRAFTGCHQIRRIYLRGIFHRIGSEAFYNCSNLIYVSIHSESGYVVGDAAFTYTGIEYVEYNNARYISNNTGNSHYLLVEVIDKNVRTFEIAEDTRAIAESAFSGCRRLQSIDIPESVSSIGSSAFEECTVLQSVRLGNRLYELRDRTFYGCIALAEIELYESLELIGREAFYNCMALTEIEVPESVQTIGASAFGGCSALESITVPFIGESRDSTDNTHFTYIFTGANTWDTSVIPENLKSITVTDTTVIPDYAFYYSCSGIETIELPTVFTSIGDYAFKDCKALKSINISNSVESIGVEAFANCESLESVTVPGHVKELGLFTFQNCKSLKEVVLSEGVEVIGPGCFGGCEALRSVTIPSTVTAIKDNAFENCAFVQISIPEGVTEIGMNAFAYCKNLTSIEFPASIQTVGSNPLNDCTSMVKVTIPYFFTIGDHSEFEFTYLFGTNIPETMKIIEVKGGSVVPDRAFLNCYYVEVISLPSGITKIGANAFCYCENLKDVNIPATVTEIGNSAFSHCYALESINIPSGVTELTSQMFYNCTGLKKIVIPDTVESFGESAFQNCTSLEELTIPNLEFKMSDGSVETGTFGQLFSNDVPETLKKVTLTNATKLKMYAFNGCAYVEIIVIPDTLTSIGDYAFNGCTNLKSINIPEGITVIATNLFNGCSSLESITLPSSVEEISYGAFANCESLTSINIPSNVHTIGEGAFANCTGLSSIVIPEKVRNLGFGMLEGCSNLQSITLAHVGSHDYTSAETGYFGYIFGCPSYSYHDGLPESLKTVTITHETDIYDHAFYGCQYIESIILPDTVTAIGNYAFNGCNMLKSIEIPAGVTSIGIAAFAECTSLESVTMHEGLKTIDQYAFRNCTSLTELVIPDSVDFMGCGVLQNCSGLRKLTIPYVGLTRDSAANSNFGSLFYIDDYSYQYTTDMPAIHTVIVTGGERIADNAFYHCQQITTLYLPETLTYIGENAFYGMGKLQTVNYEGSESDWAKISIADTAKEQIASVKLIYDAFDVPDAPINTEAPNTPEATEAPEDTTEEYVPTIPDGYVASEGLAFTSNGDGTCYVSGMGDCTDVNIVIPYYSPDGDLVTAIGQVAFKEKSIESVVIPDSVTRIEGGAFMQCYNLKDVTMSNRIAHIGLNAFFEDTALSMTSYDNAHYIGSEENPYLVLIDVFDTGVMYCEIHPETRIINPSAFKNSIIQYIVIPSSVRFIGEHAFDYCEELKEIVIMNGTTYIGQYAFHQCKSVEKLYIPASVKYVGESAFYGMTLCDTMYFGGTEDQWNFEVEKYNWAFAGTDGMERTIIFGNTDPEVNLPEKAPVLEFVEIGDGKCYIASIKTFNYKHIIIPETSPAGQTVIGIGNNAFQGTQIESIVIPDGVTYIGEYAFAQCQKLTSITLPDSLQTVGKDAFFECGGGELVCNDFGVGKYLGCDNNPYVLLLEITDKNTTWYQISEQTRVIYGSETAGGAFANCNSLENITIPASIRQIGEKAFYGCTALKNVQIEEGLIRIEARAFQSCGIETVNIPATVTFIGTEAFSCCQYLNTVTYAGTVNDWLYNAGVSSDWAADSGDYTVNCSDGAVKKDGSVSLHAGTYSEGLEYTSNGDGTCYVSDIGDCSDTDVVIPVVSPDGYIVTGIGDEAFSDCYSITSVVIPDSVTSIGERAFYDCRSLTSITIPFIGATADGNSYTHFGYIFGASSYDDNANKVPASLKTVVITGETSIGAYAFSNCNNLTSITIPDSVTSIGNYAFHDCDSLTSITIPDSVTSIGDYAFYYCDSLTSITIPDSVTSIGYGAFFCIDTLKYNEYDNAYYLGNENNPYLVLAVAKDGITTCQINSATRFIDSSAFSNCNNLTSITIPDSVTSIGNHAFHDCSSLTSITIPDSVTSIGAGVFSYCSSLTSVTIPDSVTSIGNQTFYDCIVLTSITIPGSVTSIGDEAFIYCDVLTSINFGGTTAQWNSISKGYSWNAVTGSYTIYCTDGNIAKE